MAIQQINLGTAPAGTGGDTQRAANTKINQNFSNQAHAASRLVGTASGNVMEVAAFGIGVRGNAGISSITFSGSTLTNKEVATTVYAHANTNGAGVYRDELGAVGKPEAPIFFNAPILALKSGDITTTLCAGFRPTDKDVVITSGNLSGSYYNEFRLWSSKNTTIDVNKNIKTSSPVLQVFKDDVKKIHEANQLPIKFTRNGVGDYTIEGTTGLRENDWQIVIPKDDHDNQMIAFTIEDDNGTIYLKTYKRTFSMETFLFGPDLSAPVDIPDGLWVDLHFNDLPEELINEPIE